MRTHKTKEEFISRIEKEIEYNNILLSFYDDVYLPTLLKFNGKVYNKRFISVLQNQCTNELMGVSDSGNNKIQVGLRFDKFNYNDKQVMWCRLLKDVNNRIDYDATINDELGKKWIENIKTENEQLQTLIDNYDEMLSIAQECQDAIYKFTSLPIHFIKNITLDKVWYLNNN